MSNKILKNKKLILFALSFAITFATGFLLFFTVVYAQVDLGVEAGAATGLPSTDIRLVIARIIRTALGLLGIVALVLILYGGYVWMTAGGDETKIAQAKKILVNAAIGLAIILSSYAITRFIISRLVAATTGVPAHCVDGVLNEGETGVDCGGECAACGVGGGGSFDTNPYQTGVFYVDSLPHGGELCIRNVHPAVTFNRAPDITSVAANVVVENTAGQEQAGEWQVLNGTTAVFTPNGDCGDGVSDCFAPSSTYRLRFKNGSAIRTSDGQLTLNCVLKAGCREVTFTTGNGVDRTPPQVVIEPLGASQQVGATIPVTIRYTDDNGVQKLDLRADNFFVGSQTFAGCQPSGSATIDWPTAAISAGNHRLQATAYDWSSLQGTTSTIVHLFPPHCFDSQLQADVGEVNAGPPACGGECGACGGSSCTDNSQCASGFCSIPTGQTSGTCVDRMRITGVSPLSGAPGTYVSISGQYFGATPGRVFIGNVQAPLANCGAQTNSWRPWQIIIEVPNGAASGPIRVETAGTSTNRFVDATNDDYGPRINDFLVNSTIRPALCSVVPASGLPGAEVVLSGKQFGPIPDTVFFGQQKSIIGVANWNDVVIRARVPFLEPGIIGVKVVRNGVESNGVQFFVEQGVSEDAPVISAVTPEDGARGEYITIIGRNFGNQKGRVWFKVNNNGQPGEAIDGDFDSFPPGCRNTWTDTQIVVKFPVGRGTPGRSYFVQVRPADSNVAASPLGPLFNLTDGQPKPGICSLVPVSGPVPFASGTPAMKIVGDYFGANPDIYFWRNGASPDAITNRVRASAASTSTNQVTVYPPAGTQTGPVVVYRPVDEAVSNPQSFTVLDCVRNNNTCTVAGTHCCAAGREAGLCKPDGELCEGETLSAGYVWRFSTRDIPKTPHVVERCDRETELGNNLPSPSPSIQWDASAGGDHYNVCRSAAITVEFTVPNINPIARSHVIINECQTDTVNAGQRTCVPVGPVAVRDAGDIVPRPSTQGTSYIELNPGLAYNGGRWKDTTWYQVVLTAGITAGTGTSTAALAKDAPCDANGVNNSAYCFVFKTGAQDCRMKMVIVTPYSYWTNVLEEPIKHRTSQQDEGTNLYYRGSGLSTQRCIVMDVSGFAWNWNSARPTYADIYSVSSTDREVLVSALANTVGVGLTNPDNAVTIRATASRGGSTYSGDSPLTIDLSNPEIVDFWPNCFAACTNAEVGMRFNTTMSNRNLPGAPENGTVQLLKCLDENCLSTLPVLSPDDILLDAYSNYQVLKIANSGASPGELEPNTLYKVVVSSSSTPSNQLWSAARLGDPTTFSKPYAKEFSWRFKTKNERCRISRVDVKPQVFNAETVNDRAVYQVEAFSSPDSCSPQGQKMNPWEVNWEWESSNSDVATVRSFSTRAPNPFCTNDCVRKGSAIPATQMRVPICGNGVVEAGEDCDPANKEQGCSLRCLFLGNPNATTTPGVAGYCGNGIVEPDYGEACDPGVGSISIGCSNDCRFEGSLPRVPPTTVTESICGNGTVGAGEACDIGIAASTTDPRSAMRCSDRCVHLGTTVSSNWCSDNRDSYGGFARSDYEAACTNALSICGDGIQSPDEDPGCDGSGGWNSDQCNEYCVRKSGDAPADIAGNSCGSSGAVPEGCTTLSRKHRGSSLLYSTPSVCGDGAVGSGEDAFCETQLGSEHTGLTDPWTLAIGVGMATPAGTPPRQVTTIAATTRQNTAAASASDSGEFSIRCGYTSDTDCRARFGDDWNLGGDSCCYRRPRLASVFPGSVTLTHDNICPNTAIEARFDSPMNPSTLVGNIVIARGIRAGENCGTREDVTSLIAMAMPQPRLPWYQQWFAAAGRFFGRLLGREVQAVDFTPARWCAGDDLLSAEVVPSSVSSSHSVISMRLVAPLSTNTPYAVILKDGLRDVRGVSIGKRTDGTALHWKFNTGQRLCEVASARVVPSQVYLDRVGATSTLYADAFTVSGGKIQPIAGHYAWEYLWEPADNPYVTLQNVTTSRNIITAQNRNGEIHVRSSIRITENRYTGQSGVVATGKSRIIVFLCENPWPPKNLYLDGSADPVSIFPYEDKLGNNDGFDLIVNVFNNTAIPPVASGGYFNFSMYYCADNGVTGTADDLPYLRPTVQISPSVVGDTPTAPLKRFIFTNNKNKDAIGVQIFANPLHLTAREWYEKDVSEGGRGFLGTMQSTKVDGYDALTDGKNLYVDALNYNDGGGQLYTNIYLFSINSDAQPETRKVFEQLMSNLRFNSNLTNYGYCGASIANPGATTTCQNDLDCASGEVCSVQVDKLKRNYTRLRDLKTISLAFKVTGVTPLFKEGSYLTGQTISVWPSWSVLGNAVGRALPVDPINKLGRAGTCQASTNVFCTADSQCPAGETCIVHDPVTGWSVADRRFSFACATSSYAYRYINLSASDYEVRTHFENPFDADLSVVVSNWNDFVEDFIDTESVIINEPQGICRQDQEISTIQQGVCGDGVLNQVRGEQCDPPGRIEYLPGCRLDGGESVKDVNVCDGGCRWTASTTLCSSLSRCGNGVVEFGESCDDGTFNGRYNRCNVTCTGRSAHYCGDGVVQSAYEICDPGSGTELYALDRAASCSWDCQNYGPYCGDGIAQSNYGEECDGNQTCSVDGLTGVKYCSSACKRLDAAVAWWKFDGLGGGNTPDASGNSNNATCTGASCPTVVLGKVSNALDFTGSDYLRVAHNALLMPTSSFTLEAWVHPRSLTPEWQRILEKGGFGTGSGYGLELFPPSSEKMRFTSWASGVLEAIDSNSTIALDEWAHIAAVYDDQGGLRELRTYVNGSLDNTRTITAETQTNSNELIIGRAANGVDRYFNGMLDELKFYRRALSDAEVRNNYQTGWFCSTTPASSVASAPGVCGNGVIDPTEACDSGLANNGNPCTSTYNQSCSYCSADCQNVIDVQATQYCGNGIIEASERCDVDLATGNIYAASYDPAHTVAGKDPARNGYKELRCLEEDVSSATTVKKGIKTCSVSCALNNTCVACGSDPVAGTEVRGAVINVLQNKRADGIKNPLFATAASSSFLDLYIDTCEPTIRQARLIDGTIISIPFYDCRNILVAREMKNGTGSDLSSYVLRKPADLSAVASVNSDPICSFGAEERYNYAMVINDDKRHRFTLPILPEASAASWQYDMVLSPVIPVSVRSGDMRVVISWVDDADFYGGFMKPIAGSPTIEGTTFGSNVSLGTTYYTNTAATHKKDGIWYHGFQGTTGGRSAESFTVDTQAMVNNTYSFYVRTPVPIAPLRTTYRLKVEVYMPEDYTNTRHFARPVKTYYLMNAVPSDNPDARYWHVFNLAKPGIGGTVSAANVTDVNTISTGPEFFTYSGAGTSGPAAPGGTGLDPSAIDDFIPPPSSGGGLPIFPIPPTKPAGSGHGSLPPIILPP